MSVSQKQGKQERSLFGRTFQEEIQNDEELVSHDSSSDGPQDSGVSSDVCTIVPLSPPKMI